MVDSLIVDALGVCVPIALDGLDDTTKNAVRAAWIDAVGDCVDASSQVDAVTLGDRALEYELSLLSTNVTLAGIHAQRGKHWMLHAAALALDDGRVIVLVGPSGRGKTTASRVLGEHFGYVSDETATITRDGRVLPYRKPLSIIETMGAAKVQRAASAVGLKSTPDAELRLARIVILDRQPNGPDVPAITPLRLGEALADLVEQSSYLRLLDHPLATVAAHSAATGGIVRLTYRESTTLPAIFPQLASEPAKPTLTVARPVYAEAPAAPAGDELRYGRVPAADELVLDDGGIALLHATEDQGSSTVRLLAGIGPTIWEASTDATLDDIVASVVACFGLPPEGDPRELVQAALSLLIDEGVITHATVR